ncbi:uncharacterized protein K452DRAFT_125748 [Aplosporella prunicola CBS 121167]|uniref:Major facilitator superfamily (MFS) profile domain-containing protein n=1 Tax=Aplosporella prunicola CBS 121167 TaxID=1176127 RepID=A0A6A6BNY5_9PEZI|nr:uncharacterized protein K452DRAFT_125748 [Aplosporella prunicola CBS 121167]KAF2145802.1 hypothetical protein K452DRAFT_125748 [Aplosporella prunicola CBS 121167]
MALQASNNGGSSTCVMELQELEPSHQPTTSPKQQKADSIRSISLCDGNNKTSESRPSANDDPIETLPSPTTTAHERLQRWNTPRIHIYRTLAAFFAFFIMGANDAAYGALLPYLEAYYHLSYTVVSLVFLSPLLGYSASALLNNAVHLRFGQRGVAFLGPLCHLIAYVVIALHPPYPALVVIFVLAGFGNGLEDAGWNAWIGNMASANELLGFLHGLYSVGATLSPIVATTMITKAGLPWYAFYYVMIGGATLELLTSLSAFWSATGAVFRAQNPKSPHASDNRMKEALFHAPSARVTWLCAIFLLGYVGTEVALGGWIVTFMMRVRAGAPFASGMTATGFWLGMAVGRVVLGFVTPRVGEKLAIAIYLPLTMALELVFWLVPQFYVSAVAVSLQGFFLGPMFPGAVVAATRLLPRHLHVSAVGFAAAIGGAGAAVFPFVVGLVAQSHGVKVLQPIVLALLVVIWGVWMALPRLGKKKS